MMCVGEGVGGGVGGMYVWMCVCVDSFKILDFCKHTVGSRLKTLQVYYL